VDTAEFLNGSSPSKSRIICTRGFLPVYNNEYLIQALATLGDDDTRDFHVTFAAPGPDLQKAKTLADRVLTPGLRTRVHFRNGLDRKALIQELSSSSLYVSLSKSDGASFSLLEALSCGIFPVLSDIPQNREWVTPEEDNGILVPFGDPGALAHALIRALADGAWRARAAAYNRQKVLEQADVSRNLRELLRVISDLEVRREPGPLNSRIGRASAGPG